MPIYASKECKGSQNIAGFQNILQDEDEELQQEGGEKARLRTAT